MIRFILHVASCIAIPCAVIGFIAGLVFLATGCSSVPKRETMPLPKHCRSTIWGTVTCYLVNEEGVRQ